MTKKKKKKLLAAATALALVAVISGTWAWMNDRSEKINRVKAAAVTDGSVKIEESFDGADIVAGKEAKKEVTVSNTGNSPVFIRVSYEEVLKYLASKGASTPVATQYKVPTNPKVTDDVPVEFAGGSYKTKPGFEDITNKFPDFPEGVKVYAKGTATKSDFDGAVSTTLELVVFNQYGEKNYQSMDVPKTMVPNFPKDEKGNPVVEEGTTASQWPFASVSASELTYNVYQGGYKYITKNWAESSLVQVGPKDTAIWTGAALLGTKGTHDGKEYDYSAETVGALPAVTPQALTDAPTAPNVTKGILADRDSSFDGRGLNIRYGEDIVSSTTLAAKKWVYASDGYFYYTSPLKTGETTPQLLKALVYDENVDDKYINATYDLVVKMEALQGLKAAITSPDADDWKIASAGADTDKGKIREFLVSQLSSTPAE